MSKAFLVTELHLILLPIKIICQVIQTWSALAKVSGISFNFISIFMSLSVFFSNVYFKISHILKARPAVAQTSLFFLLKLVPMLAFSRKSYHYR